MAECLLAALGRTEDEDDGDYATTFVGALLLGEGLRDLGIIRKALTTKPQGS